MAAILLVLPAVIALIAENTGHVKAVAEMTGARPRPGHGPGDRRRRRRHRARQRRSAARPPRPTPRTSASWRPPGSTPPPPTTWPPSWRSCSASRPKFGALVGLDPGRRARRHHRRALRHDRPARREDLEGERGRLRQPDQPGADRRRHHHRHRQRHARDHRRLHARAASRSAPSSPSSATTWPGPSPRRSCATEADGTAIAVGDHVYGDSDGVDDLYQAGYPGAPGDRDPRARPAPLTAYRRIAPPGGSDLPGGAVPFPGPVEQAGSRR